MNIKTWLPKLSKQTKSDTLIFMLLNIGAGLLWASDIALDMVFFVSIILIIPMLYCGVRAIGGIGADWDAVLRVKFNNHILYRLARLVIVLAFGLVAFIVNILVSAFNTRSSSSDSSYSYTGNGSTAGYGHIGEDDANVNTQIAKYHPYDKV
ncbi:hypothetical protein [Zhongshania aliphaticivorans]|uniref:hypothetical protein n=1 Tax=Zhongshania aliphaticivorans TaxID=1470434 RepID=UPI0012E682FE|nr:hypothetical protein [Zhongshania aliphaticivorans]CAA0109889.1 Uncharacterised protein [Zhongshania aliphaticivorans]